MRRATTIAGVTGLLVGVLVGFLWWGLATRRMQDDLRWLKDQQVAVDTAREQLKRVEAQLKQTEDELRREQERRSQLEMIVSQGRK